MVAKRMRKILRKPLAASTLALNLPNSKSKTEHVHTYAYAVCIQLPVTKPNYARIPPLRLNKSLHQASASATCGDDKTLPPTRPETITLAYPSLLWPTVSSEAAVQKLQGKLSNCNVTSLCTQRSRQRSVLFNAYWNKRSRCTSHERLIFNYRRDISTQIWWFPELKAYLWNSWSTLSYDISKNPQQVGK